MTKVPRRRAAQAGYTLIEMLFTLGIMGVLVGMAVVTISYSRPAALGDGGMRVVMSQLNTARELAITQRRNMQVSFTSGNLVQILREETSGPNPTTVVSSVLLEGGLQFLLTTGLPDTPDVFCPSLTATCFPSNSPQSHGAPATQMRFKPDGTFIDQDGSLLNGTVFITLPGQIFVQPNCSSHAPGTSTAGVRAARAITVLGSTGRVRAYRFDGTACPAVMWKPV